MLKLISNSCVGGFIYRDNVRCAYQTPFIWNLIDFESMYYLIKNFQDINFKNYDIKKNANWSFSIIIEDKIELKYIHYKFDKNANNIIYKDIDVYYNRIWEYIVDKYDKRLNVMLNNTSSPIFILANGYNRPETNLTYNQIRLLNDCKKNIICAVDKLYPEFTNIKQTLRNVGIDKYGANPRLAKKIYDEFIK